MSNKEIDGVEVNGKSIITSLKIIKQVCEDNGSDCVSCPFSIDVSDKPSVCGIGDIDPCNWKILEYKKFQALE